MDVQESGPHDSKFVTNSHARKKLELVLDLPLPLWFTEAHYQFSEPKHRDITHDIVDKSLDQAAATQQQQQQQQQQERQAAPVAKMQPPPRVEPEPVVKLQPPPPQQQEQGKAESEETQCPHLDLVKFWKPLTEKDRRWHNPYVSRGVTKYVTFEPDVGGWNNIRMQMEIVLVFAYATGRTLVLPPDQPMYLLNKGKGHEKHHNFRDFFPFDRISTRVPVVSMDEFMSKQGVTGLLRRSSDGQVMYPPGNKSSFDGTDREDRNAMWEYLRNVTSCPPWKGMADYVVVPPFPGFNSSKSPFAKQYAKKSLVFAGDPKYGATRLPRFYDVYWHQQPVIHFISKPGMGYRLLEHFYTFIHFEDPFMDKLYKRFVRDFVHYLPDIFCKAALITAKLREEGGGHYSSFHVRRGELQYKEVKVNASTLIQTVRDVLPPGDLLFIATDETQKGYFDSFKDAGFPRIRHLNDFTDQVPGLRDLNPNYLGMLDQVVCAGGRVFVGTWYSTFSAYITRMRGYLGHADNATWYGDKAHKARFQRYELPRFPYVSPLPLLPSPPPPLPRQFFLASSAPPFG
jgi:hypothetical protein